MRSDDNLPPGCTARDIDEAFGPPRHCAEMKTCPECGGSGKVMEDSAGFTCSTCSGEGEIEVTYEEVAEPADDARAEKADMQREADIDRQMGS